MLATSIWASSMYKRNNIEEKRSVVMPVAMPVAMPAIQLTHKTQKILQFLQFDTTQAVGSLEGGGVTGPERGPQALAGNVLSPLHNVRSSKSINTNNTHPASFPYTDNLHHVLTYQHCYMLWSPSGTFSLV